MAVALGDVRGQARPKACRRQVGAPLLAVLLGPVLLVAAALPAAAAPSSAPIGNAAPSQSVGLGLSATYDVSADVSHGAGTIAVTSTASITNSTPDPLSQLDFNAAPARIGQFELVEVRVGENVVTATLADQTIGVPLEPALEPGAAATVTIAYRATFATSTAGLDKKWLLAKLKGALTAYRWIPWLSRPVAWDRPTAGEPFVTAVSPEVRVQLTSERKLIYGTSGQRTSISQDGLTQTFVAYNVRDFNFVARPAYYRRTGWHGSTKVVVLYRTLPPSKTLNWAIRSLDFYTERLAPYPYPTLIVAETGGGNAMESPGMIWLPRGTYSSSVPYLVSHEVAHQWFYALVGSDAAEQPFADEALAEFLSRTLLGTFRARTCTAQELDRTIWEYSASCYFDVVYVQGSRYINAYRKQVGDVAFWQGLRAYVDAHRFGIGGIRPLWDALDAAAGLAVGHATSFPRYY